MKCRNCGNEFSEGVFCPECGTRIQMNVFDGERNNPFDFEFFGEKDENNYSRDEIELELQRNRTEQERVALEGEKQEDETAKGILEQDRITQVYAEQQSKYSNEGKTMSILSLIMGIIAIISCGCLYVPEILGIVFACFGKQNGKLRGMSIAGLVCSIISLGMYLVLYLII